LVYLAVAGKYSSLFFLGSTISMSDKYLWLHWFEGSGSNYFFAFLPSVSKWFYLGSGVYKSNLVHFIGERAKWARLIQA